MVAEELENWQEAANYLLQALEIFVAFKDTHSGGIATRSLARVWQAAQSSPDFDKEAILNRLATILNITPGQAQALPEQTDNDGS